MCNGTSENLGIPGLVLTHHPGMTVVVRRGDKNLRASMEQSRRRAINVFRPLPAQRAWQPYGFFLANRSCVLMIAPPISRNGWLSFCFGLLPLSVFCHPGGQEMLPLFFANSSLSE
jgi:hypothetical protein